MTWHKTATPNTTTQDKPIFLEPRLWEGGAHPSQDTQEPQNEIMVHKPAEEELITFRLGIERSDAAIFITEIDGTIRYVNPAFEKIYGYSRSEAMGKTPRILKSGLVSQEVYERFWQKLLSKKANAGQLVNKTKDGRMVDVEGSANPILDDGGNLIGFLAIQHDVTERVQAEAQVRKLSFAVEQSPASVVITDTAGRIEYVNSKFTTLTGYSLEEVRGSNPSLLKSGETTPDEYRQLWARITAGKEWRGEFHNKKKNGELFWESVSISPLVDSKGTITHYVAVNEDITDRKRADAEMQQRDAQLATLNELGQALAKFAEPEEIVRTIYTFVSQILDTRNLEIALHDEAHQTLSFPLYARDRQLQAVPPSPFGNGFIENVILTKTPLFINNQCEETFALLNIDKPDPLPQCLMAVPIQTGSTVFGAIVVQDYGQPDRYTPADLEVLSTIATQAAAAMENARLYAAVQQELIERKRAEEQLLHNAFYDVLTGLPNRALFMDRLGRAIERAKRVSAYGFAVLFLDLDRFKLVNDSLGHAIGDQLLIKTANRLGQCLRNVDTVARLGGDEFVILLEDVANLDEVTRIAGRIQDELALPYELEGHRVFVSASIGIVQTKTEYGQPEEVVRDADMAMYRAKARGKARYEIFDSTMRHDTLARLDLETDLRSALERNEFRVFYQPILSLEKRQIIGFEALVRWQHPTQGLLAPMTFIPIAEETGLIIPIGQWVLHEACRQLLEWQVQFPKLARLTVSVNLSARQFVQPDLSAQVCQILKETGLGAISLRLEITESAIMDDYELARNTLQELRALGIQVQIDDFGTGYSSLSYLQQFSVDTLKIDRSFINKLGVNDKNAEIVRMIVLLAREMGLKVTAEGVETQEQLAQLQKFGCEFGQGYLFSKPLDAASIASQLGRLSRR